MRVARDRDWDRVGVSAQLAFFSSSRRVSRSSIRGTARREWCNSVFLVLPCLRPHHLEEVVVMTPTLGGFSRSAVVGSTSSNRRCMRVCIDLRFVDVVPTGSGMNETRGDQGFVACARGPFVVVGETCLTCRCTSVEAAEGLLVLG